MSEELKGTKTEANLRAAFAGESQARNRYSYYSDMAKQEGFEEIAKFFEDTARNEQAHAKAWYKLLNGNVYPDTKKNLEEAIKGEHFEHDEMYPAFARTAKEEGFDSIAFLFYEIGKIEQKHEEQCKAILECLNQGTATNFRAPDTACMNCGHEFREEEQLENCPVCGHSAAFFMRKL
jgi:rubrerythrin